MRKCVHFGRQGGGNHQSTKMILGVWRWYAVGVFNILCTWCCAPVTPPKYTLPGTLGTRMSGRPLPCSIFKSRRPKRVRPRCKIDAPPSLCKDSSQSPLVAETCSSPQARNHSVNSVFRKCWQLSPLPLSAGVNFSTARLAADSRQASTT